MAKGAAPLGDSFVDVQMFANALVNEVRETASSESVDCSGDR